MFFFFDTRRLLSATFTSTLLIFLLPEIVKARISNHTCNTSCGSRPQIRPPFRLDTHAANCGDPRYQLVCENDRTVLHLYSRKFYVEDIFYDNFSMRVVDPGIRKDDCSSLPLQPLMLSDFKSRDAYALWNSDYESLYPVIVTFISCPVEVQMLEVEPTSIANAGSTPEYCQVPAPCDRSKAPFPFAESSLPTRSYAVYGEFAGSDVKDSCAIGMKTPVSNRWLDINVTDFQSIHAAMAYGFELLWFRYHSNCTKCEKEGRHCYLKNGNTIGCARVSNFCWSLTWSCILDWLYFILRTFVELMAIVIIGLHIAMAVLCGFPCMALFLVHKWRRRHLSIYDDIEEFLHSQNNLMPIRYSYSQLKKMTGQFKDKVGEGGYGSVYKGKLRSGSDVAVKMLGTSKAGGQEFTNEVATIGRIHHANVVRLVGFCVENSKRALVYDFLPNGSLEKHIFLGEGNTCISWEKMHEIAVGVARGIEYLHKGCDIQILHFDIKPHNILLDENLAPQISDFGLAKLYDTNNSIVSLTGARGTMGYMAPELFYKNIGSVSSKADVYSFGMMLMEMTARRKNLNAFAENLSQIFFPSWAYDHLSEEKDLGIGITSEETEIVKKMIIVALWCIQMKPHDRPSMKKVIEMLEGTVENISMPPKPFICPRDMPNQ